jgi:hypothetical protein
MSFWVKHRFLVAISIFIISSVGALLMIKNEWPAGTDFRYPLVIAVIGLGFTLAQFLFQIYENRFQKINDLKQEETRRLNDLKLFTYKETVNRLDVYIEFVNRNIADIDSVTLKDFVWSFNTKSNSLDQFLHNYLLEVFLGLDRKREFIDFTNRLNALSDLIDKMEKENVKDRKRIIVEIPALKDHVIEFNSVFKELARDRDGFLITIRREYLFGSTELESI